MNNLLNNSSRNLFPRTRRAAIPEDDGPFEGVTTIRDEVLLRLAAQAESLDERTVAVDVDVLEVTQEAAALAHEQQQTTT